VQERDRTTQKQMHQDIAQCVTLEREAKKIQVTEGATIENLSMRVGQRISERKVAGTVVWKDGRALEEVYLAVYSGDKYVRRVDIEKNGTFNFTLSGDFAYSVEALDSIDDIEGRSQRIKIPQGNSAGGSTHFDSTLSHSRNESTNDMAFPHP
jgi:hypothetical protein